MTTKKLIFGLVLFFLLAPSVFATILFQDDFEDGLDVADWDVGSGVSASGGYMQMSGTGGWSVTWGARTDTTWTTASYSVITFEAYNVSGSSSVAQGMYGLKNISADYDWKDGEIYIYRQSNVDNGGVVNGAVVISNFMNHATFSQYDAKIQYFPSNTTTKWFYKQSGTSAWSYEGSATSGIDSSFKIGVAQKTGTWSIGEIKLCDTASCDATPTPSASNQTIESVVELQQNTPVQILGTTYATVFSGTITAEYNGTAYLSTTLESVANLQRTQQCRVLVDGVDYNTETNRTMSAGQSGNTYLFSSEFNVTENTQYDINLQCRKAQVGGIITITKSNTHVYLLYDDQGNAINSETMSLSITDLNSTYELLYSGTFDTTDTTTNGLIRNVIIDGEIAYSYDSTSFMSLYANLNGSNSSEFIRYGTAGSSGSGGGIFIFKNVTGNASLPFKIYGKSSSGDGSVSIDFNLREQVAHSGEAYNLDINGSTITPSSWKNVASVLINNSDHASSGLLVKGGISTENTATTTVSYRFKVNDTYSQTYNRTIGSPAGSIGVSLLQELYVDLPTGFYNVTLQAKTSTASVTIVGGSASAYIVNEGVLNLNSYNVTLYNIKDNTSVNTFNVTTQSGARYSTTTGLVTIFTALDFNNLTLEVPDFYDSIIYNHNTSTNLNQSVFKAGIKFTATEIITGNTVSPANYTIFGTTKTNGSYFYLGEGEYNVTFSKAGWYSKTVEFNSLKESLTGLTKQDYSPGGTCSLVVAYVCTVKTDGSTQTSLNACESSKISTTIGYYPGQCSSVDLDDYYNATATYNIPAVSSTVINVTATSLITGNPITSFSINISNDNYSYSEVYSTSVGWVTLSSLQNVEFNITIDAPGFALQNVTITPNATLYNYTFNLYTTNSINITFKDVETQAVINDRNISIDFIGSILTYNYTTDLGYLYADLITPDDYIVRYSADGYDESFYYFTMSNRSTQQITLYLLNSSSSTDVTINIIDENGDSVESALVKVLRFDSASGTYIQTEAKLTNFEGQTVVPITLNTEFYKFIIEYPTGTIVKTTQASYITGTTLNIQVILSSPVGANFYNLDSISYLLTFSDTNNEFTFTYSDAQNLVSKGCLRVYRVSVSQNTLLNSSCAESSAGSITIGVTEINGSTYKADAFVYYGDDRTFLSSLFKSFYGADLFGVTGLFLTVVLMIFAVFIVRNMLPAIPIVMVLPLIAMRTLNIIAIGWDYIVGLIGLALVIAYILGRSGK